jgi:hypothetical protein
MATVIDNFRVPTPAVTILSGSAGPTYTEGKSILGGVRRSTLGIGLNPYGVPANLDISEGYLKLSTGAGQFLTVDVAYGILEGGLIRPLSNSGVGDFLSMGRAIRTKFVVGDGRDIIINYNIVIYTASGYAHYGDNVHPRAYGPTPIDFPFDSFGINSDTRADLASVSAILFRFQSWADFVIDSFEIV